ncbi:MAG: hypothetical protein H7839_18095 [Magnetococcus sp. YQC-5]
MRLVVTPLCEPVQDAAFLPGVPVDSVLACYDSAPGNEIASGKLKSPGSSAALVANTFGFFLGRAHDVPILPGSQTMGWPALSMNLEEIVRFPWSRGRHPCLDVLITTRYALIGVESKRFEPFWSPSQETRSVSSNQTRSGHGSSELFFSQTYWRPCWGKRMARYEQVRDHLRDASLVFKYLDAVQLVKQAFALRTEVQPHKSAEGKLPVLFYLFVEPSVMPGGRPVSPESIQGHRDEVVAFANAVAGDEVIFLFCSYRTLLNSWIRGMDESVRLHVQAVSNRFCIPLHGSE